MQSICVTCGPYVAAYVRLLSQTRNKVLFTKPDQGQRFKPASCLCTLKLGSYGSPGFHHEPLKPRQHPAGCVLQRHQATWSLPQTPAAAACQQRSVCHSAFPQLLHERSTLASDA